MANDHDINILFDAKQAKLAKRRERYLLEHPLAILPCGFCNRQFKQNRAWQRFCTPYCARETRKLDGREAAAMRKHRATWSQERRAEMRKLNAAYGRERNKTERVKRMKRDWLLRQKYGISLEQLETMINAHNGICPLCECEISAFGKGRRGCAVDHDHKSGQVRGALCQSCNIVLGAAKDNIETLRRAIKYLTTGG